MTDALSVLIVDDHQLVCEAVISYLSRLEGVSVKGCQSFADAEAAIAAAGPFDVVLLDLHMPDMKGMQSVAQIVQLNAGGNVVLFSGQACQQDLRIALEIGCKGLIPKDLPLVSLESAVRLVASGEIFVRFSASDTPCAGAGAANLLDERELAILKMVSEGKTNKEIAWVLKLSEITVKSSMRKICMALDTLNRAHAVTRAKELNLI
jgi:two-component system nitrate/nitrite response regulator NarP